MSLAVNTLDHGEWRRKRGTGNWRGDGVIGIRLRSMLRRKKNSASRTMTSIVEIIIGADLMAKIGVRHGDGLLLQRAAGLDRGTFFLTRADGDDRAVPIKKPGKNGRAGLLAVPNDFLWGIQLVEFLDLVYTFDGRKIAAVIPNHALPRSRDNKL